MIKTTKEIVSEFIRDNQNIVEDIANNDNIEDYDTKINEHAEDIAIARFNIQGEDAKEQLETQEEFEANKFSRNLVHSIIMKLEYIQEIRQGGRIYDYEISKIVDEFYKSEKDNIEEYLITNKYEMWQQITENFAVTATAEQFGYGRNNLHDKVINIHNPEAFKFYFRLLTEIHERIVALSTAIELTEMLEKGKLTYLCLDDEDERVFTELVKLHGKQKKDNDKEPYNGPFISVEAASFKELYLVTTIMHEEFTKWEKGNASQPKWLNQIMTNEYKISTKSVYMPTKI